MGGRHGANTPGAGERQMIEGKTALALWSDYRFLTKELIKFIAKKDYELFYNILEQREQLQGLIEQTADNGFRDSQAGQDLLAEMQQDNERILREVKTKFGKVKQQHKVSSLYCDEALKPDSQKNWDY